jgi:hypothetical protein
MFGWARGFLIRVVVGHRSSKAASPYLAVTCALIPLGGRQLADRESEHCQLDANEILPG